MVIGSDNGFLLEMLIMPSGVNNGHHVSWVRGLDERRICTWLAASLGDASGNNMHIGRYSDAL